MFEENVNALVREGVFPQTARELARQYPDNIQDAIAAYQEALAEGWAKGPGLLPKFVREERKPSGRPAADTEREQTKRALAEYLKGNRAPAAQSIAKPKTRENWQAYQPAFPVTPSAAAPIEYAPGKIAAAVNEYFQWRDANYEDYKRQLNNYAIRGTFDEFLLCRADGEKYARLILLQPEYFKKVRNGEFGAGASFADYVAQAERPPETQGTPANEQSTHERDAGQLLEWYNSQPQPAPGAVKPSDDEPQAIGNALNAFLKPIIETGNSTTPDEKDCAEDGHNAIQ